MLKQIITVIFLLISVSVNSAAAASPRITKIIGGSPSDPEAWTWMAGLVPKHSSIEDVYCGASLIAKDWVLTAAHCVIDENSSSIDIIINQAQLDSSGGERLAVRFIIMHPLYDDITLDNDLALIKLATPSENVPIDILSPFTTQDDAGTTAIALGWGTVSTTAEQYPLDLHQVNLPIIDNLSCHVTMGDITDDMLCAGAGLGKKDTCFGDSGGPLLVYDDESESWHLAGITSWGFGCAERDFYGVYTRLKNYATFISGHICSARESLSPPDIQLDIQGNRVHLDWHSFDDISGYRLNYAPYPDAQVIYSIDMNQSSGFSIELGADSAYYVAITSYKGNCLSDFSHIEHFVIK